MTNPDSASQPNTIFDTKNIESATDYKARYEFICRASAKDNDNKSISTDLETSLNELTTYITHDLADLARRGCPDSFADILHNLELELVRFRQFCEFPDLAQRVIVGIGGKFSAGKSSFINTLLGKKQLVVEIDPTTSLPTYLLRGEQKSIAALNLFDKKVTMSFDEFQSLTHDEKRIYGSQIGSLLTSAFISDPDFIWQNLALLDTPGYTKPEDNQHSQRTDANIARSQLNAAQFIVWLVSAEDGTIKEDDLQFLASLNTDIPKLVLVNKSDKKTPDDIASIVSLIKTTLVNRNLPVLDVIPVSRKTRDYPTEPVKAWFDKWNEVSQEVQFGKNFKRQFCQYEEYIETEECLSHHQLNHLNRILVLSDSEDVDEDTTELKGIVEKQLQLLTTIGQDLKIIQQLFFSKLASIGEQLGINIPKLDLLNELDLENVDLNAILHEIREEQGTAYISYNYEALLKQFSLTCNIRSSSKLISALNSLHVEQQYLQPHELNKFSDFDPYLKLPETGLSDFSELTELTKRIYATILIMLVTYQPITRHQTRLLGMLLNSMGFDDNLQPFYTNRSIIDKKIIQIFCGLCMVYDLATSFLMDALTLCRLNNSLNDAQSKSLSELVNLLNLDATTLTGILHLSNIVLGEELNIDANTDDATISILNQFKLEFDYDLLRPWHEFGYQPIADESQLSEGLKGSEWWL